MMAGGRIITIALDLTPQSRDCFTWSVSNLYKDGDKLYLLHVSERSPVSALSDVHSDITKAREAEKQAAYEMLKTFATYCVSNNITYEAKHLLKGYEHDVLQDLDGTASNLPASGTGNIRNALEAFTTNTHSHALVMGAHKRSVAERLFSGNNTEAVLHHVHIPVVIVKCPEQVSLSLDHNHSKRKIGVCVDSSEEARAAFDWVARDFHHEGDMVYIIHVSTGRGSHMEEGDDLMDYFLSACVSKSIDYHMVHTHDQSHVSSSREMVDLADCFGLDCLVVGCRGRGSLKRTLLGSFSDGVVRDCKCNVIVVKS